MSRVRGVLDTKESEESATFAASCPGSNDMYEDGSIDPVYQAKARVLNKAIEEIGMGRYQVGRLLKFPSKRSDKI